MIQSLLKVVAILLVLVTMMGLGYGLRMALLPPPEAPTGAELKVICLKCREIETARVTEIHACFCSKCGSPVAEAWRCQDCHKVFPFVMRMPKDRVPGRRGLQDWAEMHRCPFCNSTRTEPLPLQETEAPKPPAKRAPAAAPTK